MAEEVYMQTKPDDKKVDQIFGGGKARGKIDYFLAKVFENSHIFTK
jgi:hypothetical protein